MALVWSPSSYCARIVSEKSASALVNFSSSSTMDKQKDNQQINLEIIKILKDILISVDTFMLLTTLNFSYIRSENSDADMYYRIIIIFIVIFYFYFRVKYRKN